MNSNLLRFGMVAPGVVERPTNEDVAQQTSSQSTAAQPQGARHAAETGVLKLKGLPYNTTKAQLLDFFQDFKILRVEFVYEPDGRPSGLAFAEFESREEAIRAMSRNGQYLGDRYVKLLLVSHQEMKEQITLGTLAIPSKNRGPSGSKNRAFAARSFGTLPLVLGHRALPSAQLPGGFMAVNIANMAGNAPALTMDGPHAHQDPRDTGSGTPMGQHYMMLQPRPPHQMPSAIHSNAQLVPRAQLNPQFAYPTGGLMQPMQQMQLLPSHMGPGQEGPGIGESHQTAAQNLVQPAVMNQGQLQYQFLVLPQARPAGGVGAYNGRTIKMRGLPFKATPNEVLHFFLGYQLLPETLFMGRDAYGRPSGEAWLAFASADEALRAVAERNRQYLRNRYLELSLC